MFSASGTPANNPNLIQRSVPGASTNNERAGLLTSPSLQHKSSLINTTPDPVGVKFNSLDDAAASVKGLRTWNIVLTIGLAVALGIAIAAGLWAWGLDRPPNIQPDSLTNNIESRVVEFGVLFDNTGDYTICSGGHIGSSGQVLSAAHCVSEPGPCEFNITAGFFEPNVGQYWVEVMGVNETGDKISFPAQIFAMSGMMDILLLQLQPINMTAPGVIGGPIEVVDQDYFSFGNSRGLTRGDTIVGLSYDEGFIKKLTHTETVQSVATQTAWYISLSAENVFFSGSDISSGASGSLFFDKNGNVVVAPLSYGWDSGSSGTSSYAGRRLIQRAYNPATPPNGPPGSNRYLIPTIGIAPYASVGLFSLYTYENDQIYVPTSQAVGVQFYGLTDQTLFDFYNSFFGCGYGAYTVTPPSLAGAPADQVIFGEAPNPFPDISSIFFNETALVLEALEIGLGSGNWQLVGEDAGLNTVNGLLMSHNYWAGDVIRVRIRAFNPYTPTDPTQNYRAIYRVTLQAVDPYWDTIDQWFFFGITQSVHVNRTQDGRVRNLYYSRNDLEIPRHLAKHSSVRQRRKAEAKRIARVSGGPVAHASTFLDMLEPLPENVNPELLPTMHDLYHQYVENTHRELFRKRDLKSAPYRIMGEIERTREVLAERRQRNERSTMTFDRNQVLQRKKKHDAKHTKGANKKASAAKKLKPELNPTMLSHW